MSSSQQQPTNPNNNNNNQSQIPINCPYGDYEEYPPMAPFNNLNMNPQALYGTGNDYAYPHNQVYSNNYDDDNDDDIPSDVENEINATEMLRDEQINDNYGDEIIFTDDVQNAFANYENEFSKHWTNKPNWENFTDEEQEEMFDQMRQCMMFMTQEYATAEMSGDLMERAQESQLNPDAVEFRPSGSTTAASTESELLVVLPYEVKNQGEGEE